MALIDKNYQKVSELLEILEKEYEKIKIIVEEDDYENSERFRNFMAAIDRRSDFEVKTFLHQTYLTVLRLRKLLLRETPNWKGLRLRLERDRCILR